MLVFPGLLERGNESVAPVIEVLSCLGKYKQYISECDARFKLREAFMVIFKTFNEEGERELKNER